MARSPELTDDLVLQYLGQNTAPLSADEILSRIRAGEGWEISPNLTELTAILKRLSYSGSSPVSVSSQGDRETFLYKQDEEKGYSREQDLYQPLVEWLDSSELAVTGKILAVNAGASGEKGEHKWRYPDVVGHSSRADIQSGLAHFFSKFNINYHELYSFEVKREILKSNVRQYFFQCLANSAWANRRYLITTHISDEAMDEFRKLSRVYGMGLIRLACGKDGDRIIPMADSALLMNSPYNELDIQSISDLYGGWKSFREWIDALKL